MVTKWRLEELADRVGEALAATAYEGQSSGRVREVPDARTIRYYTTLGILDRPIEMRGRTAYYGPRHLQQLVAIKRLQSRGMSLVEIQAELAGADTRTISRLAGVPKDWVKQLQSEEPGESPGSDVRPSIREEGRESDGEPFWASVPKRSTDDSASTRRQDACVCGAMVIHLAPGVTLTIEGVSFAAMQPGDLTRIQQAAAPLVDALKDVNGVVPNRPTRQGP